jgi:hypothetical protein
MKEKPAHPSRNPAEVRDPASKPGAPGHDEWLVDESIEETFPASDPIAPSHSEDAPPKPTQPAKK